MKNLTAYNFFQACNDLARKNDEAVSLMNSGKYEKAIERLSSALASNKKLITGFPNDDQSQYPIDESQRSLKSLITLDQCLLDSTGRNHAILSKYHPQGGLHPPYIYSEGIRILPGIDQAPSCYSHQITEITSTIIIFNLALAHHLSVGQSEPPRKLLRALKLYKLALDLQRNMEQDNCSVLFTLSTVNNMAIIRNCVDESQILSLELFEYQLSILLLLLARGGEHPGFRLAGFQTNAIFVLAGGHGYLAPAA
jgi:tetratricopeptide (TPR) repeat protein